jgi:hypothetical protein
MSTTNLALARANADGLAVIGRTLHDLRGIRFDNDEGGNAPAAPSAPSAPAAPATVEPLTDAQAQAILAQALASGTPAAPSAPATPTAPKPIEYRGNPDEYVRELREEAKNHRIAAEKAASDLAAAQKERDDAAAARDQLARERALLLVAPKYGARADALLDSSSFMKTFATVDLSKEDDVKKAIEDALEKNSALKAGPSLPPTSGGGHQGGQISTQPKSLNDAVAAKLSGQS